MTKRRKKTLLDYAEEERQLRRRKKEAEEAIAKRIGLSFMKRHKDAGTFEEFEKYFKEYCEAYDKTQKKPEEQIGEKVHDENIDWAQREEELKKQQAAQNPTQNSDILLGGSRPY